MHSPCLLIVPHPADVSINTLNCGSCICFTSSIMMQIVGKSSKTEKRTFRRAAWRGWTELPGSRESATASGL